MRADAALAPDPAATPRPDTGRRRQGDRVDRRDALVLGALAATFLGLFVVRAGGLPLQLWDESRNANNALEAAFHGHWLVPTYAGAPDHWNTKPPLLIWIVAGLLKLGAPPLLALRLPSAAAALATLGLVWGALRFGLRDALAAGVGGALLLSSWVYVGPHAARTGDYDALESLFVTAYALAVWRAFQDRPRGRWLFAAAAAGGLAVMTKGVAGVLAGPGLVAFALLRPRRTLALAKAPRPWLAVGAAMVVCLGYYASRELYDPGYVGAVLTNEVGGRFGAVSDNHQAWAGYYVQVLLAGFEPGCLLLPLAACTLQWGVRPRRDLVLACGLAAGSLLAVLSIARSKLDWYATPMVPLLALTAAVGTADAVRRVSAARPDLARALAAALALTLAGACALSVYVIRTARTSSHGELDIAHLHYGRFLDRLEALGLRSVRVVDGGFYNDARFAAYDPMLRFYADPALRHGLAVSVSAPTSDLDPGTEVASCDPEAIAELGEDYRLAPRLTSEGCLLARIIAQR